MDPVKYNTIKQVWKSSSEKHKPKHVIAKDESNNLYYTCEDVETIVILIRKNDEGKFDTFGIPKNT